MLGFAIIAGWLIWFEHGNGPLMELGPVAGWLAATATTLAAVIALWNSERNLTATDQREQDRRREDDRRWRAALTFMADRLERKLGVVQKHHANIEKTAEEISGIIEGSGISGIVDSISRIPAHTAPSYRAIDHLEDVEMIAQGALAELEVAEQEAKISDSGTATFDLSGLIDELSEFRRHYNLDEGHLK
jgi:hypothetical protein